MSLAFVFPGQGSQSVGMLGDLAADTPVVATCFDEASEVLGYDLWQLLELVDELTPGDRADELLVGDPTVVLQGANGGHQDRRVPPNGRNRFIRHGSALLRFP